LDIWVEQRIRELERSFRRAGVPNLIEGYSAAEDVFTRALPFLTLVFVLELFNALDLEFPWWGNVLAFLGGVGFAGGAFGSLNLLRGRRFASIPTRVGGPELAAFVVVPALVPLIFNAQWRSALVTTAVQLAMLGLVYLVVAYGLFSILRWAGRRFVSQLRTSLAVMVRALPLLLFFALITFFTNEYWQMFSTVSDGRYLIALVLFVSLGTAFLLTRLPTGVRELERESDLAGQSLSRAQRANVGLVIFVSQSLQILFVAAAVWLFFVVFGALLVDRTIQHGWIGHQVEYLRLPWVGTQLHLTRELLRVATGTAAFSGLYYTVATVVDSNYRDEFVTRITQQMRETFALRAEYLRLLRASRPADAPEPSSASRSSAGA
jgi:hypothetical protein